MTETQDVFDAGLQSERTALAWRRTALSVALGALVSMRLLPALLGEPLWVIPGFIAVVGAGTMWITGERRYRAFYREQVPRPHTPFGAWPLLLTAAGTVLLSVGALALALILLHR